MGRIVKYAVGTVAAVGGVIVLWAYVSCSSPLLGDCSKAVVESVQWTDLIVALSSVFTFVLLLDTAIRWRAKMVRDGAYTLTQDYVQLLGDVDEALLISFSCYDNCVPQPGRFVLTPEEARPDIMKGEEVCRDLELVTYRLRQKEKELRFWKVRLSKGLQQIHDEVLKELSNYFVMHGVVGNKLRNYYIYEVFNEQKDIKSMNTELEKMRDRGLKVQKALNQRFEMQYDDCFVYTSE